ncbi:MAG: hypothetical protein JSR67_13175 [Proteobacteria bacterium]|nr:hypothetical protein [Pseudomonadota bacterium]
MTTRGWLSLALAVAAVTAVAGCDNSANRVEATAGGADTVNGSIHVAAGQHSGSLSTVNGGIHIDDGAEVGSATTVNGSVHLGARAGADSVETVNGGVTLVAGAHVAKGISAVNGALSLKDGAQVAGKVSNVNGDITLQGAHVGGGLRTVSGDIDVEGNSHVEGGIVVHKQGSGWLQWHFGDPPKVVIGPGAVVAGELRFERKVLLYISDQATVGPIIGATAIRFSGARPPA